MVIAIFAFVAMFAWLQPRLALRRVPVVKRPRRPRGEPTIVPVPRIVPSGDRSRVTPTPAPPAKLHRDQLSPDRVEHALLAELRRDPSDAQTRMVYADLLEQRGHAAKASFVRGTDTDDDPAELLDDSDFAWRAIVAREPVQCGRTTCPRTWDMFGPTADDERLRTCFLCKRGVRYCETLAEERGCAERGDRGVVDLGAAPRR